MKKMKSDTTLKIFAVIISLVLWSFVMREVNPNIKREHKNVNVEFLNTEELEKNGLVIMNPKEATVDVKVEGEKFDMGDFSFEDIKASVDLSGYSEGKVKVPINVTLKQLSNIKIEEFTPREILFTFDKIIAKDKVVTIKTSGELAAGYVLGEIQTKSPSVLLRGPRTWVNEVAEAVVDVNLEGRKEDINVTAPVKLIDDEGNNVMGVSNEPSVIDVTIPVYKTITVPIEVQTINELPENYEATDININPSSVTLKGKENALNLKFVQTKPIDINLFIENEAVETELELPKGVSLLNPNEKITVSQNVEQTMERTFEYEFNEVELKNLDPDLELDPEEEIENIEIRVKGVKDIVEELTKEDIEIYLDMNTAQIGENETYISFDMPTGITIEEINPQPISLKIIDKGGFDE